MALFGSPNHITGRDAQDELIDALWPGLRSDPNPDLHMHRDRCYGKISDALLAALAADETCGWTDLDGDKAGNEIRIPRAYWNTDRAGFYFYSGEVETGAETKHEAWSDLERYYQRPWYLLRSDFEQFKKRLLNGGPAQYVSLFDALHYVAASGASAAAVMRWECDIHQQCRHDFGLVGTSVLQEKFKERHSSALEAALAKLHEAWQRGILRPLGRLRENDRGSEDYVPQALAERCEFLPLGPGEGSRIEPKDAFKSGAGESWHHVRFLRNELGMLLPGAPVADPMAETHWTIPQCIAWIASREPDGVSRATNPEGLRALAGAMAAASLGNFSASHAQLLKAFRTGLACTAINRQTGEPDSIPLSQRAHIEFDLEHNAALIKFEIRWYELRFPVAEILKAWPPAGSAEDPVPGVLQKKQTLVSSSRAKRALIEYRATLNGKPPLKQKDLRDKISAEVGYMAEKPFRELLREIDTERKPDEPALMRGRGKSGESAS